MAEPSDPPFDPYVKWLAIRDPERPPNHYRLLGLDLLEDDTYVIACAADRQIKHVRQFLTGRHPRLCRQLLKLLSQARGCLLEEEQKRQYDAALRHRRQAQSAQDSNRVAVQNLDGDSDGASVEDSDEEASPGTTFEALAPLPVITDTDNRRQPSPVKAPLAAVALAVSLIVGAWLVMRDDAARQGVARPQVSRLKDDSHVGTSQSDNPRSTLPADSQPAEMDTEVEILAPDDNPDREVKGVIDGTDESDEPDGDNTSRPDEEVPVNQPVVENASSEPAETNVPAHSVTAVSAETIAWYLDGLPEPSQISPAAAGVIAGLRRAMARRDVAAAQAHLDNARMLATTAADRHEVERLGEIHTYWAMFWRLFDQARQQLQPGQRLLVGEQSVAVTEVGPEQLSVRTETGTTTWSTTVAAVDPQLAAALVTASGEDARVRETGVRETTDGVIAGPVTGACVAAMLAMDRRAERSAGLLSCIAALGQGLPVDALLVEFRDMQSGTSLADDVQQTRPVERMSTEQEETHSAGNNSAENNNTEKHGFAKHPRPSVPDKASQKEALGRVRSVYAVRYKAATTDTQRVALARFLIGVSAKSSDDLAARYVLLRESTRLATNAGDWALVVRVIDITARWFDVDALVVKTDLFHKNCSSAAASQLRTIRSFTDHLFMVAIAQDRFDVARRLAQTSLTASRRDHDRPGTRAAEKRIKAELSEFKARHEASQAAERTLAMTADDRAAHAQLGKYLCYNRGGWSQGLPHLARGDDALLAKAAEHDQNIDRSADPNNQKRAADAWFAAAEDRSRTEQKALLARASFWYRAAMPRLAGISRDDAEYKLTQIKTTISPGRAPNTRHSKGELDLLSQVDLSRHVIAGPWRRQGSTLVAVKTRLGAMPRVVLPFAPQGSYQLDVTFTSPFDNHGTIAIWLPVGSTGALLLIHDKYSGIFRINNQPMSRNPATVRYANKLSPAPHDLSIRVLIQGDRVRILTLLDGNSFVRWQGPIDSLTDPAPWQFPNKRAIALGSWGGGVVYHRCTCRPAD